LRIGGTGSTSGNSQKQVAARVAARAGSFAAASGLVWSSLMSGALGLLADTGQKHVVARGWASAGSSWCLSWPIGCHTWASILCR